MWRLFFKLVCNITVWSVLAAFAGHHIGLQSGYQRGVRDVASLIITLREADQPPAPFTKGGI